MTDVLVFILMQGTFGWDAASFNRAFCSGRLFSLSEVRVFMTSSALPPLHRTFLPTVIRVLILDLSSSLSAVAAAK